MKRWTNIVSQALLTAIHVLNIKSPYWGWEEAAYIATVLGVIQMAISGAGHSFNPDGTSAATPYNKH